MSIKALIEEYIKLCKVHGCNHIKSITPIEYKINVAQNHVIDGKVKLEVTTYTGKSVMLKHINECSYADNLQILKNL